MTTIGVQLYSAREDLKNDFEGTIRKIAAMGYNGVETAGEFGGSVENAVKLFQSLGLQVIAAHSPMPLGDNKNKVLDTFAALGTKNLVCPFQPPERFQSLDSIYEVCDMLTEANEVAQANGLRLLYHNHHFELLPLDGGAIPLLVMAERLAPSILFEIDTYWVQVGGSNVVDVLNKLGSRAALLHIKDGPGALGQPMLAVGEGVMQFPPILAASQAEALIVELDSCATNMLTAIETSYTNLKALL